VWYAVMSLSAVRQRGQNTVLTDAPMMPISHGGVIEQTKDVLLPINVSSAVLQLRKTA